MAPSVLLIDDDPDFRATARHVLTRAGAEVVGEADTVAAGEAAARELRPGAILVDFALPDGDGVSLTRALAERHPEARIVVTSVDADATTDAAARAAGALAFRPKHELPGAVLSLLLGREG